MHALDIDFVPRRRFSSVLGGLLFVAGIVAAGSVATDYLDASEALSRVEARQTRLLRPTPVAKPREAPAVGVRNDAQIVDGVTSQLSMPWDLVLREIEMRADPAVALLSFEFQGQAHTVRLTGEAKSMTDIVAYVSHLRESPWVGTAYLSGHEEKQLGAVKVIRFTLDATWRKPS